MIKREKKCLGWTERPDCPVILTVVSAKRCNHCALKHRTEQSRINQSKYTANAKRRRYEMKAR